jgi:uncharacterized protein (TIGR00375 family)
VTYVADLHIHSPYAIGTSPRLSFDGLARWAGLKGIDLLATGDFTHPAWLQEARGRLAEGAGGLLELGGARFVLGTEVSCVARQGGRGRRVHLLVLVPGFEAADRVNAALAGVANLAGDGRPTLRMSPRDLLSTVLDADEASIVIPAHLWTPWYGLYGSKSGFDSLEECFGDLTGHVHAVETGLSSDPAMNWRVKSLDGVSLVSFSDAHSLPNLGRELTVFEGEPSYDGLAGALREQSIAYTVEFFPEEGKYHHSGHRGCGVRLTPEEARRNGPRCPECGRPLTLGVMQRIEELAGRDVSVRTGPDGMTRSDNGRPPFRNLVGLRQIVSEGLGAGPHTKRVDGAYLELVSELGGELAVLTEAPQEGIARLAGDRVADGVARVRRREVAIEPGFDGRYGTVKVWPDSHGPELGG